MRILNVTAQKPEKTGSGIYISELMKAFDHLGCEQALVAGVDKDDIIEPAVKCEFYPVLFNTPDLPFSVVGMSDEMPYESTRYRDLDEKGRTRFIEAFHKCLSTAVQDFNPDLIVSNHLYYLTSMLPKWFPDKKIYGICHGSDLRQFNKNTVWPDSVRDEIRCGISMLDRIYALNDEQKKLIREAFEPKVSQEGYSKKPDIEVLGTGYDSSLFHPRKRILFAGKLSEKKGVFSLLRALRLLHYRPESIEIILCGGIANDKELDTIRFLESSQPYAVTRTGHVDRKTLAGYMQSSDLFILPSFSEGLPLVLLEALACGDKLICTDLPGIRQWLDGAVPGHGVIFIAPPQMYNEDEALKSSLVSFEQDIADAITEILGNFEEEKSGLRELSFDRQAEEILKP